jgi:3-oxoacyl-[acyl-carrier protein] reductase
MEILYLLALLRSFFIRVSVMDESPAEQNEHRHIVVSGGSRGLGQALVVGLLEAGYRVSAFSRNASEFSTRMAGSADGFCFEVADVRDERILMNFLSKARDRFGIPYGLVNCAGVAADEPLATMREEQAEAVVSINLLGAIRLTRLAVREMLLRPEGGGSIVNISSVSGLRGYRGLSVYSATKAGLDGLTRSLARELGPSGIRVNSVAPGYFPTDMTAALDDAQRQQIARRTPLGRIGALADIVGPVKFFLSDEAAFVTGTVLVVDGGMTA